MRVKVFKFEVSNFTSTMSSEEIYKSQYRVDEYSRLVTPKIIEDTINEFIYDKKVIDIKTDMVHTEYHNNGCSNTMHMIYTVMYE